MGTAMRVWRYLYGDHPLHLMWMVACFALVGYSMSLIRQDPSLYAILLFFVGAVLVHDLVLYPLYAAADQTLTVSRWARRRVLPRNPPAVPAINHVRLPAMGSALLGLIWFPTLTGRGDEAFGFAAGLPIVGRYENWLLLTGLMFGISAAIFAVRSARVSTFSGDSRRKYSRAPEAPRPGPAPGPGARPPSRG